MEISIGDIVFVIGFNNVKMTVIDVKKNYATLFWVSNDGRSQVEEFGVDSILIEAKREDVLKYMKENADNNNLARLEEARKMVEQSKAEEEPAE